MKTYRIFSLVLYDNNFNEIYDNVIKNNYNYFYIKHKPEEEDKKEHYHLIIYTEIPTTISKIAKSIQLEENYINVTNDTGQRYTLKNTIGYLIHYNIEDKIHYELEDIKTNVPLLVKKYYSILTNTNNDQRDFLEMLAFIEDNEITAFKDLAYFSLSINALDILKKYQYIFINIIRDNKERRY